MSQPTTTPAGAQDAPPATNNAAPAAPVAAKPAEVEEEYPDPDEDDLDDLDDMLEDFSSVKLNQKADQSKPTQPTTKSEPSAQPAVPSSGSQAKGEDDFSEEDFAKQLQAGMADLLGELDQSPEMQAQFDAIFKEINAAATNTNLDGGAAAAATAAPSSSAKASDSKPAASAAGEASFQDTIRATMERMQNSGEQATAAAASGGEDDFMAEMLKAMGSGDFNPDGGDSEDFSKMLMGMMEQLTNKEILYEPMKELHDKFPEWLEKNKAKTPEEDLKRYEVQQKMASEIVAKFEESTYSDSNAADREYIVDRMQKMQAQGSPPNDLVGDMASAQEAFGGIDDSCNTQ